LYIGELVVTDPSNDKIEPYGEYKEDPKIIFYDDTEELGKILGKFLFLIFSVNRMGVAKPSSIGTSIKFNLMNWLRIVLLGVLLFQILMPIEYHNDPVL
jgi:hypothetical protein